jgi:hypothetical protein
VKTLRKTRTKDRVRSTLGERGEALIRLLESWLADESGYDEKTWPRVKAAIEANRLSYRKRFHD